MANTLKFGNGEWAIKEGSALAYNDENGNFKPLPFDFTRASTATYVAKDGLIKTAAIGEPRIDFLNDSEGALKLEPQRTNVATYSNDFSNAAWIKTNSTITANTTTSPDGTQNASTLVISSSGYLLRQYTASVSAGGSWALSIFAKNQTTNFLRFGGATPSGTDTYSIQDMGNGWYRHSLVRTFASANASFNLQLIINEVATHYIWGGQIEQGSYPTSYIPTQGSTVTRVQDVCYNNNIGNVIGQTEGTFYIETIPLASTTSFTERIIQFESSGSDFITFQRYANSNLTFYGTDGSNSWTIQGSNLFVGGETIKIAGAYKDNDIVLYANGVQIGTNNTANAPQVDRMWFANNANGSLAYSGSHKEVKFYNTRLSNSELETLTTL